MRRLLGIAALLVPCVALAWGPTIRSGGGRMVRASQRDRIALESSGCGGFSIGPVAWDRAGVERGQCSDGTWVSAPANAPACTDSGCHVYGAYNQSAANPSVASSWSGTATSSAADQDVWTWAGGSDGDRVTDTNAGGSQNKVFAAITNPSTGKYTASCWFGPETLSATRILFTVIGGAVSPSTCTFPVIDGGRYSCTTTLSGTPTTLAANIYVGGDAYAAGSHFVAGCNLTPGDGPLPFVPTAATSAASRVESKIQIPTSYPWTVTFIGSRDSEWLPASGVRALWSVNGSGANSVSAVLSSAGLSFNVHDADNAVTSVDYATAIGVGERTVVAIYESPTSLLLYVDGLKVGTLTTAGTGMASTGAAPLIVGGRGSGEEFNGRIKRVSVCSGVRPRGCGGESDDYIAHMLFYGQSLSVGSTGTPALSTTQPYANLTFAAGPKSTLAGSIGWNPGLGGFKALVEDTLVGDYPAATRGETTCSGAANYASFLGGGVPASRIHLASTAGHGGYSISMLAKNSTQRDHDGNPGTPDDAAPWYQVLIDQVTAGKALADSHGIGYHVPAVGWLQGEGDSDKTIAYYAGALSQLATDIDADVREITGQQQPVRVLTYQQSPNGAAIGLNGPRLAMLQLAQADPRFSLVTPLYHLPAAADGMHLSNLGYLWLGHYFGRAYFRIEQGLEPQWINPLSATLTGSAISISFSVPVPPLVLDSAGLGLTQNYGFKVVDSVGDVEILSATVVSGDSVELVLAHAPVGSTVVRYALDHPPSGCGFTNCAGGNLRDSEPATFLSGATEQHLWNVAPHFEMPVVASP